MTAPTKIPNRHYKKILKLKKNRFTYREIALKYDVTRQAVYEYLKRLSTVKSSKLYKKKQKE